MKLTENEKTLLKGSRDSEYSDPYDSVTWTFSAIENSGLDPKVARGVLSSLVKKELVIISGKYDDDESTFEFTEKGRKIFDEHVS
jgi:hypothetical protein